MLVLLLDEGAVSPGQSRKPTAEERRRLRPEVRLQVFPRLLRLLLPHRRRQRRWCWRPCLMMRKTSH